jgi:hypothetical protein
MKIRIVHQAFGDGDPLLLPAGEFRRTVKQAITKSHHFSQATSFLVRIPTYEALVLQGNLDVFQYVWLRNQITCHWLLR